MAIDRQLTAAGWVVQDADRANVAAGPGVAVAGVQPEWIKPPVYPLPFIYGPPREPLAGRGPGVLDDPATSARRPALSRGEGGG
jgi:hypothetical protein